jgi:hypothetical protein
MLTCLNLDLARVGFNVSPSQIDGGGVGLTL